ncbi:hypothetical protein PISMIDRAFT_11115 [Pisolithus microcarpus 441]|uniref:Uncharacterized protein n=1 Tax=Pisolithus microcarpus 441 TaxID=765257 RepID=A0A0C9ZTX6_9AGAM|nr:hypothetical protein PISMIDRAFT_11115 [Pisolithus microcarpus 441]
MLSMDQNKPQRLGILILESLFYKVEDGILIIVAIYVDDKLILSRSQEAIE